MPRIARAVAVGFPHHIIQRGNNRQKVFFAQETRKKYLSLLKEYLEKWDASLLVYCLMSNHVHLLIRPNLEESLAKIMQGVSLCYTQYFNRRYKKTGRLWESRYHSCIVDKERYLWMVARYIEQNPVRAKIVRNAENYSYSSARAHITGEEDKILGEALFSEDERSEYIRFIKASIPEKEITAIRKATRTGVPLGNEKFIKQIKKVLKRGFGKMSPGRPRK
jgi:putative transposase